MANFTLEIKGHGTVPDEAVEVLRAAADDFARMAATHDLVLRVDIQPASVVLPVIRPPTVVATPAPAESDARAARRRPPAQEAP